MNVSSRNYVKQNNLNYLNDLSIVIFGATGNLSKNKLLPSIVNLVNNNKISKPNLIGIAHKKRTNDEFVDFIKTATNDLNFYHTINYLSGETDELELYRDLEKKLLKLNSRQVIFILAVAPEFFENIIRNLDSSNLISKLRKKNILIKLLIEKPFGNSYESAKKLDELLSQKFNSKEIFRIDHYLGKSMLQNVYTLRSANPWFEAGWNSDYVEGIEINFLETLDTIERGAFYDQVGAWRDVGQNHLLQMLAAVMIPMKNIKNKEGWHENRSKLFDSLEPTQIKDWKRKQYIGYREQADINPNSNTETYFKIILNSNLEMWQDVPITLAAGKKINHKNISIALSLRDDNPTDTTKLIFSFAPHEEALIELWGQDESDEDVMTKHQFTFSYGLGSTDAYNRIFLMAIRGETRWFPSSSEALASWLLSDKIKNILDKIPLEKY